MPLHMSMRRVRMVLLLVAATMMDGGAGALAQRGRAAADNLAATVACGAPRSLHDRLPGGRDCRRRSPTAGHSRGSQAIHEDYVPDGKTAVAIAEAVSRGQLGDASLSQILP